MISKIIETSTIVKGMPSLGGTNLGNLDLSNRTFPEADATNVRFDYANLCKSDLSKLRNLRYDCFAGANLSNAKIPEGFKFDLIALSEQARTCRKQISTLLIISAYILLTAASTNDVDLLTGSRDFALPIVNAKISLPGFFFVAPLIVLCVLFYSLTSFSMFLDRLSKMPAVMPDGRNIDEIVSSSIGFDIIYARPNKLSSSTGIAWWTRIFIQFSIWFIAPITISVIWLNYLKRHDPYVSILQSFALGISIFAILALLIRICIGKPGYLKLNTIVLICVSLLIITPLSYLSVLSALGKMPARAVSVISALGHSSNLALHGAIVSRRPQNWTPGLDPDYLEVSGAELAHSSLRSAGGQHVFLARANLTQADLDYAKMPRGRFQYTDFTGASGVNGMFAFASFRGAHFHSSTFTGADFRDADFSSTVMKYGNFHKAKFEGATFNGANLEGANFSSAYLVRVTFKDSNLKNANFVGAQLYSAKISGDLSQAILTGSDLRSSDLSQANGLTVAQIESACLNQDTKLPSGINWSGKLCE